uniref:Uncharacterized protein n=1 Tax=Arundo donax TaxID=35708 RepID=A0A0A9HKC6_ARUDO
MGMSSLNFCSGRNLRRSPSRKAGRSPGEYTSTATIA